MTKEHDDRWRNADGSANAEGTGTADGTNDAYASLDADVVVAHDQCFEFGGAERVAVRMGQALDAPVVTTAVGPEAVAAARDRGVALHTFADAKYRRLGGLRRRTGLREPALLLDWASAPLSAYDIVVTSGWASRAYRTTDGQSMLNYCHSPYRPANDLFADTLDRLPASARPVARLFLTGIDLLDWRSTARVDAFLANSDLVRERIHRYYRREATVIYPPVDLPAVDDTDRDGSREPFFLSIGRLTPEKRPDVVFEAFRGLDYPLKVVGAGSDALGAADLVRDPPANVEFLGTVSEAKKVDLLRRAAGVVYVPVREDFGLVPVEALAVGTPVVTADEGFPARVIEDGVTGAVVDPTPAGVREGVERVAAATVDRERLRAAAEPFSADRFETRLRRAVATFLATPDRYRLTDEPLLDPP
jgi:glycosyltransferase involved in cell wall biosynthesis